VTSAGGFNFFQRVFEHPLKEVKKIHLVQKKGVIKYEKI